MKNKLKNSFLLCLLLLPGIELPVLAKEAIGWHWYNEIYQEDKELKDRDSGNESMLNIQNKSAIAQMSLLRSAVQEAKAKAILYPTVENMRAYLVLQNFVTKQAGLFVQVWKKALLEYPELDYSILHPTQNNAQHIIYAENTRKEKEAIKYFSKKYGLFFFYRGSNPLDQALAPIVSGFSKENSISLIPISIDGKLIDSFANNHLNHGQAEKLGIKYFPALVLVDPTNQKVVPLHYGFISDSELHRRFLQIATGFKNGT